MTAPALPVGRPSPTPPPGLSSSPAPHQGPGAGPLSVQPGLQGRSEPSGLGSCRLRPLRGASRDAGTLLTLTACKDLRGPQATLTPPPPKKRTFLKMVLFN